jgi:sugar phosphate isomerase/epimerase
MPLKDPSELGLCSVTLRALSPPEVVARASAAGLTRIEWGADRHAPPGDVDALRGIRDLTEGSGMVTCSYGSYWRAGSTPATELPSLLDAAEALGAGRVRIWAGVVGSDAADAATRAHVVDRLRLAADLAAERGIGLACEFHADTLADTPGATLDLLEAVDRPNLSTYWQPPVDLPDDVALAGLDELLDRVSAVHVFSWWPGQTRLPLQGRGDLWRAVLARLQEAEHSPDLLLEFVPGDDAVRIAPEAGTLRSWVTLARGCSAAGPPRP